MKNKIFIFSMIIFLVVGFALAKEAIAGASGDGEMGSGAFLRNLTRGLKRI